MNHETVAAAGRRTATLTEVKRQFQGWRRSREKRSPIPERLWQGAEALSKQHSISEIAKALRLDYTKLKERIVCLRSMWAGETWRKGAACGFVEVGMVSGTTGGECLVEVEDGTGRKLKVHLRGASGAETVQLAKALWEAVR